MRSLSIATPRGPAGIRITEPAGPPTSLLILGHGAGGDVDAPDLTAVHDAAVSAGVRVALVTQPYRMAGRRAPAPALHLDEAWTAVVAELTGRPAGSVPSGSSGAAPGQAAGGRGRGVTGEAAGGPVGEAAGRRGRGVAGEAAGGPVSEAAGRRGRGVTGELAGGVPGAGARGRKGEIAGATTGGVPGAAAEVRKGEIAGGVTSLPAGGLPVILGGRSSGARVACRTAASLGAAGVLALAFPLHPPGKPERSRAGELPTGIPTLIVNGDRDPFGVPEPAGSIEVAVRPGAVHDLRRDLPGTAAIVLTWLRAHGWSH